MNRRHGGLDGPVAADLKKALITGGAGFIGSHLVDYLLSIGMRVTVIDDLSSGTLDNLPRRVDSELEVVVDTVLNESALRALVEEADVVFHLAAAVGVRLIVEDPNRIFECNANGTAAVLRACAQYGRGVLIASSSEVYGKSRRAVFSEDDDLMLGPTWRPRWSYACSKAMAEFLGQAYYRKDQLPSTLIYHGQGKNVDDNGGRRESPLAETLMDTLIS